jgi:hypothetical protein
VRRVSLDCPLRITGIWQLIRFRVWQRFRWNASRLVVPIRTSKNVSFGGAGLAAAAIELGLVDELRVFRYPVVVGGGTPFLPPVTEDVPLDLIEPGRSARA